MDNRRDVDPAAVSASEGKRAPENTLRLRPNIGAERVNDAIAVIK
jgi:hypothetical protein